MEENKTIIYSAKVPKGWGFFDALVCTVFLLAIMGFTIVFLVENISNTHKIGELIFIVFILLLELIVLFLLTDMFAWHTFGNEKIHIHYDQLIIENNHRLINKVRSVSLADIDDVEIDDPDNMFVTSTINRLRNMRHRGHIVIHNTDGTSLRMCMSPDMKVLTAVAEQIRKLMSSSKS